MNPINQRTRATVGALILTLAFAAPAVAVSDSTQTAETLEVAATISISDIPATTDYGTGLGGTTRMSVFADTSIPDSTIVASTNNAAGMDITINATALTSTSPSATIARTQRAFWAKSTNTTGCTSSTFGGSTAPTAPNYTAASGAMNFCSTAAPGSVSIGHLLAFVFVPSAATPAVYTGTVTIAAVSR